MVISLPYVRWCLSDLCLFPFLPHTIEEGWAAEAGIGTVSCSDVAEPKRRLKADREDCSKLWLRLRNEHSKFRSEAKARRTADRHGSGFKRQQLSPLVSSPHPAA